MTDHLAPAERDKLAKLLGMLGSNHAGERDAAGLAATRLLKQRGLAWKDVLAPKVVEKTLPHLGTWRVKCAELLEHRGSLRAWELRFVVDLPQFRRLSTKQRYVLDEIVARVLGEESA